MPEISRSGRWTPSRAGIINIWRYYDEVFTFHEGRLLLRGPNGSGKSKALELLLPFLFDANLRASRLSTFGTGERTMHWNLMGEGSSATTRVGYVWLEFGSGEANPAWFTCGCRLQASTHTTTVHADYFVTRQRVGEPAESEPELLALIDQIAARVTDEITKAETIASGRRDAATAKRAELTSDFDELRSKRDRPPKPPVTRTANRTAMAGAPFWKIVDFAVDVPDQLRGPIEAALMAAGLLDAWVGPAGQVHGHDTFADPAMLAPVPGRSLAAILVPEPDSPVPAAILHRLLSSIAYDDQLPRAHPAGIGADGTWRLGNAHGSWHQDHPAHIGAGARERARQERLRGLMREIDAIEQTIASIDADLAALRVRRDVVAGERAVRPGHRTLNEAAQAVTRADSDLAAADTAVRRSVATVKARGDEVTVELRRLTALASEHGLPTEAEALDTLSAAIGRFQQQAENWLDEISALASARQVLATLVDRADRSAAGAAQREEEAGDARASHEQLAAKLAAVEATVSADYRDVLAKLDATRKHRAGRNAQLEATQAELLRLSQRLGQLESARVADATARDTAVADRDVAAARFRQLATGVFAVDSQLGASPGTETVRGALDAARQSRPPGPTSPTRPPTWAMRCIACRRRSTPPPASSAPEPT